MATDHDPTGERLPIDPDRAPGARARPGRVRPSALAAVALGATLGASARYGLAQAIHVSPDTFPWATFVTNVSGSFVLGIVMALILERFPPSRHLRPFLATGFLGAFTTYSTFAVETDLLVKQGHAAVGVGYAAASLVTGFVAVWTGISIARTVPVPFRGGKP